jgi:hypothetical protein
MISKQTAERMRAAGFPQTRADELRVPGLEEIIDAIGPHYQGLSRLQPSLRWEAYVLEEGAELFDENIVALPGSFIASKRHT